MNDSDIREGVKIDNKYRTPPTGHTFTIAHVGGIHDDSTITLHMQGPAGIAPLKRSRKLIRDHFKLAD